jgi:hypothetical protein
MKKCAAGEQTDVDRAALDAALALNFPRLSTQTNLIPLLAWLQTYEIKVLNIAGPQESQAPGIYLAAKQWVYALLQNFA